MDGKGKKGREDCGSGICVWMCCYSCPYIFFFFEKHSTPTSILALNEWLLQVSSLYQQAAAELNVWSRCSACSFRACSFVSDWWVGTIPNRIASLIYINFELLDRFRVQSDRNEQALFLLFS
jgi:hypothetical protein